jgi:hypothetical protein
VSDLEADRAKRFGQTVGSAMKRWSIYIDVEGFGVMYRCDQRQALAALSGLMDALFQIASRVFSISPDRLFIHQFGDGFVVVSDLPETQPERPLAITIAVMRHLLAKGVATKAAVSAGDFSDVFDCYPPDVRAAAKDRRHVEIGDGLTRPIHEDRSSTDVRRLIVWDCGVFFTATEPELVERARG